jgi:hypothetical protein
MSQCSCKDYFKLLSHCCLQPQRYYDLPQIANLTGCKFKSVLPMSEWIKSTESVFDVAERYSNATLILHVCLNLNTTQPPGQRTFESKIAV